MDGAARTNAVAAGEYDLRDGRHQAGLARGLVADEDEFRQRGVMVDAERLEGAQSIVEALQVLPDVLEVLVDVACLGHVDIMVGDGLWVLLEGPWPHLHEDDILSHLGVLLAGICGGHGSWADVSNVREDRTVRNGMEGLQEEKQTHGHLIAGLASHREIQRSSKWPKGQACWVWRTGA